MGGYQGVGGAREEGGGTRERGGGLYRENDIVVPERGERVGVPGRGGLEYLGEGSYTIAEEHRA